MPLYTADLRTDADHANRPFQPEHKFNVHVYREMRLYFPDIQAETTEAAAAIAIDLPTGEASLIDDCDGRTLGALIDLVGDSEYRHSRMIDTQESKLADKACQVVELLAKCAVLLEQHASERAREAIQEIKDLLANVSSSDLEAPITVCEGLKACCVPEDPTRTEGKGGAQ
jgi:hypothetical protein